MILNFRCFIENVLFGGSKPCYTEDVEFLESNNIQVIVSLEKTHDEMYCTLHEKGFEVFIYPIEFNDKEDLVELDKETLSSLYLFIEKCFSSNKKVFVHCSSGIRRTGYIGRLLQERFAPR